MADGRAPRAAARTSTTAKGRAGEDLAVAHLERQGYVVVARNVRAGGGEIDIIAREGTLVCFVEVRRRARVLDALVSVDAKKQRRLVRAATAWLARQRELPRCRFDVAVVTPAGIELVRGAFEAAP
ncbi:MAG: YraN family protein [Deltaproteobacteria bacterium]|nr:YraN family protein [Deltaproteobacteria bacterium]